MGLFFIATDTGQVATLRQLVEAGLASDGAPPSRPWHRIQGPGDASTLWYAVLRKKIQRRGEPSGGHVRQPHSSRYVFIGALAIRHQPHHASLLASGWEEVAVDEIGLPGTPTADAEMDTGDQAI